MKPSVFVQQQGFACNFGGSDSWVILSPIEQNIKRKIEATGIPLKEWDIQINYGIKTGFNDAFIISTEKRDEILANCQTEDERGRTAEIIRPILRGRDIKRYGYNWTGLWLINTHNGVKGKLPRIHIEDYPAVKAHLDQHWDKISTRTDKGDTPYNLRNCAYMEDFSRPKILYPDIMRLPRSKERMEQYPYFALDTEKFVPEATLFMMTGNHIEQICRFLCSEIGFFVFVRFYMGPVFDNTGFRYKKEYLMKLPIPVIPEYAEPDYEKLLEKKLELSDEEKSLIYSYKNQLVSESPNSEL